VDEKTDARSLSADTQEQLREQGVRLRKKGESFIAIAELQDVHRNTVLNWWTVYENKGAKDLKSQQRGRREGDHRTLMSDQEMDNCADPGSS